jgi:hypothetical protein
MILAQFVAASLGSSLFLLINIIDKSHSKSWSNDKDIHNIIHQGAFHCRDPERPRDCLVGESPILGRNPSKLCILEFDFLSGGGREPVQFVVCFLRKQTVTIDVLVVTRDALVARGSALSAWAGFITLPLQETLFSQKTPEHSNTMSAGHVDRECLIWALLVIVADARYGRLSGPRSAAGVESTLRL